MESPARQVSLVPPPDRRQSETALAIARGTARLLRSLGFSCISELPLPSGRRADLVALNERGEIWIVEIKSSLEDLRADQKWQDYRAHCDRLFFAFTPGPAVRDFPRAHRPDRRRRLWRPSALRGAGASAAGADPQVDDGAFRDGRGAADQPAGRSAGARRVLARHPAIDWRQSFARRRSTAAAGAGPPIGDGVVCAGHGAKDQPAGRSAGAWEILERDGIRLGPRRRTFFPSRARTRRSMSAACRGSLTLHGVVFAIFCRGLWQALRHPPRSTGLRVLRAYGDRFGFNPSCSRRSGRSRRTSRDPRRSRSRG